MISDAGAKHRSIIFAEIQNYSNLTMVAGTALIQFGLVKSGLPQLVKAGTRDAFAVRQNLPVAGVEMAFYWNVGDFSVGVVAKSYQQGALRRSNQLGVCIIDKEDMPNPNLYSSWDEYNCYKPWKIQSIVKDMQCCLEDFCVQANTTTWHQPNVTVKFWPKSVKNLHDSTGVSQKDLDEILSPSETCYMPQPDNASPTTRVQSSAGAISILLVSGQFVKCWYC